MDFWMEALSPVERAEMEVVRRDCGEASCGEEGMVWLAVVCEVSIKLSYFVLSVVVVDLEEAKGEGKKPQFWREKALMLQLQRSSSEP